MELQNQIEQLSPHNEQEAKDKEGILAFLKTAQNAFKRENEVAHFTASAWVLNQDKDKVLMIYHNQFQSWAWTGGHADGETNLLEVAMREVKEETGITDVRPITEEVYSVEILPVAGHVKKGKYVSSHLHMNVTYLLETKDTYALKVKPDENSGVKWFSFEEAIIACSEPWMRQIYRKLNEKTKKFI